MNNILQLKGRFTPRSNPSRPGSASLPKGTSVSSEQLILLSEQLSNIYNYWYKNREISGALISVHYKHVIAKSNRLKILLSENSNSPSESIRGAKFIWEENEYGKTIQKHVFTYYVSLTAIQHTIQYLQIAAKILNTDYHGNITSDDVNRIIQTKEYNHQMELARTNFLKIIVDCYYVEKFDIDRVSNLNLEESIVTIYRTDVETKRLLEKFGIYIVDDRIIDGTTIRLMPDEIRLLEDKASYLISMSVTDFTKITKESLELDIDNECNDEILIEHPTNEPVIGVIDTLFNEDVYFHEWVEYHNMLDDVINETVEKEDFIHGTAVDSIIVDGPKGNPQLEDGCGHFRVRHFGVATHIGFSSFSVLKQIRTIVETNRDIKVWNLSLGSQREIKENFISPEAAELDRIQNEYDVIFVVAGTNKTNIDDKRDIRIGSPADSLNSLVVNSVDFHNRPATYTRTGPVLSFFHKPDVSYYGGDLSHYTEKMVVCCDSLGSKYVEGTSFAAPWVARKLAYLIEKVGLSREVAKALIIDASARWNRKDDVSHKMGYGIVPIHIDDILHTTNDEIRLILTGTANEYETYTYDLPIPVVNGHHPYYARATLVYFPQCDRNQGVDYTSTEMDIHFGRIAFNKDGKPTIKSIDNNRQSEEGIITLYEEYARKMYRKWDNIKHISESIKKRKVPKKAYENGMWGLSIKTKERLQTKRSGTLSFGVVVTLKEMSGVNRIDEFIRQCKARGWLVNRIDVENQLQVYEIAEEEVIFE